MIKTNKVFYKNYFELSIFVNTDIFFDLIKMFHGITDVKLNPNHILVDAYG